MLVESVLVEVRRNLKCAHVYLEYLETDAVLNVVIQPTKIILTRDSRELEILLDSLEIDVRTLSALIIKKCSASFRVSLTNSVGPLEFSCNESSNLTKDELKTQIFVNKPFQLLCSNCRNHLFEEPRVFKRILELPSGSIGISEWFCHGGPSFENVLIPKIEDIFYGFHYILINKDNLCNYKLRCNHVYCNRCLQYLGQFEFSDKAFKIWDDNVCIMKDGESLSVFENNDPGCILISLLNKLIRENTFESNVFFMQHSKILFEAVFPDRKCKYLMINVLERNLELLKGEKDSNVDDHNILKLLKVRGFKILFKTEEDKHQPLLKFWQTDINVHCVKLSHKLLRNIMIVIKENTKFVPEVYKCINDFFLSYIFHPP